MTKLLLTALVVAMLALTGLVAYNSYNTPATTATSDQVTAATDDDSCTGCCQKESVAEEACPGCPLGEKGGGCSGQVKSACCGGDAAVKPGANAPKAEAKKE